MEQQYRELKLGEIIKEGDEFYSSFDGWRQYYSAIGNQITELHINAQSRRPLKKILLSADSLNTGIRMLLILANEDENITLEDKEYAKNHLLELLQ